MLLTETKLKNAKPTDKPIKLFDGGGLYLLVMPRGSKWWRFKYWFGGKEKGLLFGEIRVFHRPHPSPNTDKGAVASICRWFEEHGVKP